MECVEDKEIYKGKLVNFKRKGKGVLTISGKEFFVEYNDKGKEIPDSRKRTFEGIRIMIGFNF